MSLRAAFEDILGVENLVNPVTGTTETEIVEILEEVQEAENEVGKTNELVEILEEESAALESLIGSVNTEVGMTRGEAVLFTHALESIGRRIYMDTSSVTSALEDIGGSTDRVTATLESADGAKNFLARMWAALKAAVVKAYNAVKNWLASLFKGTKAIEAKADATIAELKDVPATTETEIEGDFIAADGSNITSMDAYIKDKSDTLVLIKQMNKEEEALGDAQVKLLENPNSLAQVREAAVIRLAGPGGEETEVAPTGKRTVTKPNKGKGKKRESLTVIKATVSQVVKLANIEKDIAKETGKAAKVLEAQQDKAAKALAKAEASALKETDKTKAKAMTDNAKSIANNIGKGAPNVAYGYRSARESGVITSRAARQLAKKKNKKAA